MLCNTCSSRCWKETGSASGGIQQCQCLTLACAAIADVLAEDAMDGGCIVPCALEDWFRPVLQNNKFGNPDKLKFRYSAH